MQTITLRNFKSYEASVVTPFHPRINLILGANGQGKSNFFKAIIFVLSNKMALNRNELLNYMHKGMRDQQEPVEVQLIIGKDGLQKIQRIWKPDLTEELRVNGRLQSKHQFEQFMESFGIAYSNPYNIIQQGKINQLAQMDHFQVYNLLEEATGLKKYNSRHDEAIRTIHKMAKDKLELQTIMEQLDEKLKSIQAKRGEFELFFMEEKGKKVRQKRAYEAGITNLKINIQNLKKEESEHCLKINNLKVKKRENGENLEDLEALLKITASRIDYLETENPQDQFQTAVQASQKQLSSKAKSLTTQKDQLTGNLKSLHAQVEKARQSMQPLKQKYELMSADVQSMEFQGQKQAGKSKCLKEIECLKENIVGVEQELVKIGRLKRERKSVSESKEKEEQEQLQRQMLEVNTGMRSNKMRQIQLSRSKNQWESEVESLRVQKEVYLSKLKRSLPLLDFHLLATLRKEKVKGVYGYLLSFLQIEQNVAFAFELASLSKLCTLLVEDEAACDRVITINRQIKGRTISILPLSSVRRSAFEPHSYPDMAEVFPLIKNEWMKVINAESKGFEECVKKIVVNAFGKYALVETYEIGLKVSKEFHLTCITSEREVIYSQGYLCKMGKELAEDRLQAYWRYSQKQSQETQVRGSIDKIQGELLGLQNQEMALMRTQRDTEARIRHLGAKIGEIQMENKTYERLILEETRLADCKSQYEREIRKQQMLIGNLSKKGIVVDMARYRSLEKEYRTRRQELNSLLQQQFDLEQSLEGVMKEEAVVKRELQQFQTNTVQIKPSLQLIQQLKKEQVHLKEQLKRALQTQEQCEEEINRLLEDKRCIDSKICLYEQELWSSQARAGELGQITAEQMEELQHSNSVSMSRVQERNRHKHYTAKDRLLFGKFAVIYDNYKEHLRHYEQLTGAEQQLLAQIDRFDHEKEKVVVAYLDRFRTQFDQLFRKVVNGGATDLRVKKVVEGKGFRTGVTVKVSFANQGLKKWGEFSGGQKSVIAVCMLMALQRLEPAPFYVLDEVDAALDWVFMERIMQLVRESSATSQYFITSFKPDVVRMVSDIANCYLVENEERVSRMRRISQEEAENRVRQMKE